MGRLVRVVESQARRFFGYAYVGLFEGESSMEGTCIWIEYPIINVQDGRRRVVA